MIQELLYTSHKGDGLRAGTGGGFCTVMCTQGMAPNIVRRLEQMSGYSHPFDMHDERALQNPTLYRSIPISIGGTKYVVMSRIADLRAEHSGRSNKLAHHLLLTLDETTPAGPAAVFRRSQAPVKEFSGEVKEVAPKSSSLLSAKLFTGPCRSWEAATGDAGWAGAIAARLNKRGSDGFVKVIFPLGTDCLALVDEVYSLLPESKKWSTSFSTFATGDTDPANLEFILDGTREATMLRRDRRKFVVDLNPDLETPESSAWVDAARTGDLSALSKPGVPSEPLTTVAAAKRRPIDDDDELIEIVDDELTLAAARPGIRKPTTSRRQRQLEIVGEPTGGRSNLVGILIALALLSVAFLGAGIWYTQTQQVAIAPTEEVSESPESEEDRADEQNGEEKAPSLQELTDLLEKLHEAYISLSSDAERFAARFLAINRRQALKSVGNSLRAIASAPPPKLSVTLTNEDIPWVKQDGNIWDESKSGFVVCERKCRVAEIENLSESELKIVLHDNFDMFKSCAAAGSRVTDFKLKKDDETSENQWDLKFVEDEDEDLGGIGKIKIGKLFTRPSESKPNSLDLFFEWDQTVNELETKDLCFIPFLEFEVQYGDKTELLRLRNSPIELSYTEEGHLDGANRLIAFFKDNFKIGRIKVEFEQGDQGDEKWVVGDDTNSEEFVFHGYSVAETELPSFEFPFGVSLTYEIKSKSSSLKPPQLGHLKIEETEDWKDERLTYEAELKRKSTKDRFRSLRSFRKEKMDTVRETIKTGGANITAVCKLVDGEGHEIMRLLEVTDKMSEDLEVTPEPIKPPDRVSRSGEQKKSETKNRINPRKMEGVDK